MVKNKEMYLVLMTYGEYDDYNSIPIMIVSSKDAAQLISEDLERGEDSDFFQYAEEAYGDMEYFPRDAGYNWTKIPLVDDI